LHFAVNRDKMTAQIQLNSVSDAEKEYQRVSKRVPTWLKSAQIFAEKVRFRV